MKLVIMTDIHYVSPEMIIDGSSDYSDVDSLVSAQSLIDAAGFEGYDTVLITGDLTDKGDRLSHLALIEKLRELKSKGKRVLVTTATHDFNHHKAYTRKRGDTKATFRSSPWDTPYFDKDAADFGELVTDDFRDLPEDEIAPALEECCTPEELWDLYREFGRDDAVSVFEPDFCYCAELDDKTLCLMLNDNFRNVEALDDISPTYSPSCLKWIRSMVRKAKDEGKFIFACTHHPLLPPVPAYRIGATNRNMRSPYTGKLLASFGIDLVFSGHTHFADVGFMKSSHGDILCDITTPSVRFFPPRFRLADIDGENRRIRTRTVEVSKPDGIDIGEGTLFEHYRKRMYDRYLNQMRSLPKPLGRIVTQMRVKDFYFLIRFQSKLTAEEYAKVKNTRFFDLVMELVFNMLAGDGGYTPDTPEYKVLMGVAAVADSIMDYLPGAVRSKFGGYTASQIIEPMCFNNYVPDNEAEFCFAREPEKRVETDRFVSHAGEILISLLIVPAVLLSRFAPQALSLVPPALMLRKHFKKPSGPEYKY